MKQESSLPKKWDREADVVVVGYGAAGAAAAIAAHDSGSKVLILEKAPEGQEGGNSRVGGGGWLTPEPVDKAIMYFKALCGVYTVPDDMVRVWAEEMAKNNDFIRSLGGNPVELSKPPSYPEFPGSDCVHISHVNGQIGYESLWKLLKAAVDKRRIEVLCATPGKELIENRPTKEIVGIRAEHKGGALNIRARKAVVLTCGGFENNQDMVRDFLSNLPYCYSSGTPYNTGDGIKMAMSVGADLWHMSSIVGPWYSLKVPEFPATLEMLPLHYAKTFPGGMIVIGADGKRFMNEKFKNIHGKLEVAGGWVQSPTPCPMFMIFDHTLFGLGPLHDNGLYLGWNPVHKVYHWSEDNSAELAKGWIKKGNTIDELAVKIGYDPTVVTETVQRWNAQCAAGKDAEFGRTGMLSPVEAAPFYAIELSPVFVNTQGGPRRNARAQIVRPDGNPIPRLYSAGELGSIYSFLYQSAANLGECLAFGRISGRNAALEKDWN